MLAGTRHPDINPGGQGAAMIEPVWAPAPAKINLSLHVTGRRPDRLHTLESLVVFAGVGDRLEAVPALRDRLLVEGEFAGLVETDASNLAMRALDAFRSRWPDALPSGVEIKLVKNLPVAAGIGGGSSDAAAVLRVLAKMSVLPGSSRELFELALELGADVPVCLEMQPALMSGIGEKLGRAPLLPSMHLVLVNPGLPAGTGEIFSRLARRNNPPMPKIPPRFGNAPDLASWLGTTRNDLVEAASAVVPQIKAITGFLDQDPNCLFARMSGSGPTVFGLYERRRNAADAAGALQHRWPGYWVSATYLRG